MVFEGKAIRVERLESGVARLIFDRGDASVNKFDRLTLEELTAAVSALEKVDITGLVICSGKDSFIVGADITEFSAIFASPADQIVAWLAEANALFNRIEDLPAPTVCAIQGNCLGGGFELALTADYRIATETARVGFPEVKLGIIPGFGGTVRMPRLVGADNANQWISSAASYASEVAFKEGALDALVAPEQLLDAAEDLIAQCRDGKLDYQARRKRKTSPLLLGPVEVNVAFQTAKALVTAKAGPHYPAPIAAVSTMEKAASMDRAGALAVEHEAFAKLAKTDVAANLIQLFLNEQYLKGKSKKIIANARPVNSAAVLGAGIMGGGISYQSALKGVPVIMKDIAQEGLDLGLKEVGKLLGKQVQRGRLGNEDMLRVMSSIRPSLSYSDFDQVDVVVEAVVENPGVKKKVLQETEQVVKDDAIIATNTSTISVSLLAGALKRPQNFCGMHFFNPVPVMPLVEVIKGDKSSNEAIASVVAYAARIGKTPIVVNDCPGFLVNRILFPYFGAFSRLIRDGANFLQVDRAMEQFGWPMGPAYLLDVVGIDTAVHAQAVMAEGFPDRMQVDFKSAIEAMFENKRLGQKSGSGFYRYEQDARGKPKKLVDEAAAAIIEPLQQEQREFEDSEIIERMMICMCLETVRCLEDKIIDTPVEADMGLILGLGFPPFRGGALRYMDTIGLKLFCGLADKYSDLGPLYHPTDKLRQMAAADMTFYPRSTGQGARAGRKE